MSTGEQGHSLRGPIDRAVLIRIRDIIKGQEPLATPSLDDPIDPENLGVKLDDGLCDADSARIDVQ